VIADQSVNYVERYIIDEGHTVQRLSQDYGYDLLMFTHDERGYAEAGVVFLQLKASETWKESGKHYPFDLDVRDYNLWMLGDTPVFLVLFDATRRKAYWLHVQAYFRTDARRRPKRGAKTVRVRVPRRQVISRRAVAKMRELKRKAEVQVVRED
jgi:hypothetical protein